MNVPQDEAWYSAKELGIACKDISGHPIVVLSERPFKTSAGKHYYHIHSGTFSSASTDTSSVSESLKRVVANVTAIISNLVTNAQYQLRHK